MKKFDLNINGTMQKGFAERIGTQVWFHVNGKTFSIETSNQKNRKSKTMQQSISPEIIAPMPGKITAIKKNVGDTVKAGDIVIVMEAMKMEYSLKSQIAGKIIEIKCKDQQQVVLGELLAKIGESK